MASYYDSIVGGDEVVRADVQAEASKVREEVLTESMSNLDFREEREENIAAEAGTIPSAIRAFNRRSSQFEKDDNFKIDEEMRGAWESEYSAIEIESLNTSKSNEHLLQIKQDIKSDRQRASTLASYGTQGVLQTVVASLLDPPSLVVSALTGGYGTIATGTKVVRALKLSGVGALELGAYESVMVASDTQKSIDDVYTSMALGGLIGGGIGALTRAKAGKSINDMDNSITADANRSSVVSKERTLQQAGAETPLAKSIEDPSVDKVAVNKAVNDYDAALRKRAEADVVTPRELSTSIKKLQQTSKDISARFSEQLSKIKKSPDKVSKLHAQESKVAESLSTEVKKVEASYSERLKKLESKAKKLEAAPTTKGQAKYYKAQQKVEDLRNTMNKEVAILRNRVTLQARKLKEEVSNASAKVIAKRDEALAKNQLAIKEMEANTELARTTNQARNKLRKWDTYTPQEKALIATEGKLPVKTAQAELESVNAMTLNSIEEQGAGASASAAKVGGSKKKVFDLPEEDEELVKGLINEGASVDGSLIGTQVYSKLGQPLADRLQSLHSTLGNSASFAIRGLNHMLFETAQGGKARGLTASAVQENNKRQILGAMRYRLTEGFRDHVRNELGGGVKGWKEALTNPKVQEDFNKRVMLKVENPTLEATDGITSAADGVRDLFRKAGEIRKASGEVGFENLKLRDNYLPKVINPTSYRRVVSQIGDVKAKELISKGYQEGHFEIPKKSADRLAEARHIQLTESTLTLESALSRYGAANVDQMRKDLTKAGVDEDIIESLLENTLANDLKQGMSNRAKSSLDPSLTAEVNGVKLVDIMENNLSNITESYSREAAGSAALAQVVGAKSPAQMDRVLTLVEKSMVNNGMSEKRITEELQMMKDGIDLLLGRSINTEGSRGFVAGLSRMRDLTGLLRLQNMGLASIPETARAITSYGLSAVIEGVPNLGVFGSKGLRQGDKMSGSMKRKDLEELDEIMHYYGDDFALHDPSLRYESFEDIGQTGKFTQLIDQALAQGRNVQSVTSGFRAIQGAGEKLALRALSSRLKKQLLYNDNPLKDWQINDAGWSSKIGPDKLEMVNGELVRTPQKGEDFLADVSAWMKENPKTANVNGREVDVFNFGEMPVDMQQRLQVGMQRLVYRDMQRMNVGEQSTFMNKWLGQTLFQFRGFPLASIEKQLVHDVKADKIHAAQTLMVSAGLAYMSVGIKTGLASFGREDGYAENRMTGINATMQVINSMGQTSGLSLVGDGLATLGMLPEEMYSGQGRMGYKAIGADYVPVVGLAGDITNMASDVVGLATGDSTGQQVAKDIQNLVPFAKTVGVGQAISAAINED